MNERDAQLLSLLNRAHLSLLELAHGGEWAALVPDEVSMGAAKEQREALAIAREIRAVLGFETTDGDLPGLRMATPAWRLVTGTVEAALSDGWHASVTAYDGGYHWSLLKSATQAWAVGSASTFVDAQRDVVAAAKNEAG